MTRTRGLAMAMGLALFTAGSFAGDAFAKVSDAGSKLPASNPFAQVSTLPFHAPPFNLIKMADYAPAFEEGMRVHLVEIEAIANDPAAPTVDNTIVTMERSGALLTRVAKVFFNLAQSNTNEDIQKLQAELAPKLAAHQDEIALNPKLFARVKALYDKRDSLGEIIRRGGIVRNARRKLARDVHGDDVGAFIGHPDGMGATLAARPCRPDGR